MPRKKYYYETGGSTDAYLSSEQVREIIFKGIDMWEQKYNTNLDNKLVNFYGEKMSKPAIAETLFALASLESSLNPRAKVYEDSAKNHSHGLFQLNDTHFEGGKLAYTSPAKLLDQNEVQQVVAALEVANEMGGFTPWMTYHLAHGEDPYSDTPDLDLIKREMKRDHEARMAYSKTFESPMTATGSYEGFVPHGGPTSMYE